MSRSFAKIGGTYEKFVYRFKEYLFIDFTEDFRGQWRVTLVHLDNSLDGRTAIEMIPYAKTMNLAATRGNCNLTKKTRERNAETPTYARVASSRDRN